MTTTGPPQIDPGPPPTDTVAVWCDAPGYPRCFYDSAMVNPFMSGYRLASYLALQLTRCGFKVSEPIAEDFGYVVEATHPSDDEPIYVVLSCAAEADGAEPYTFRIATSRDSLIVRRYWVISRDVTDAVARLRAAVFEIVRRAPGLDAVEWEAEAPPESRGALATTPNFEPPKPASPPRDYWVRAPALSSSTIDLSDRASWMDAGAPLAAALADALRPDVDRTEARAVGALGGHVVTLTTASATVPLNIVGAIDPRDASAPPVFLLDMSQADGSPPPAALRDAIRMRLEAMAGVEIIGFLDEAGLLHGEVGDEPWVEA